RAAGARRQPAAQQVVPGGVGGGAPDNRIGRGVEDPVQGDGQLDDAEVRAQVAAIARHRLDQELPDLAGEHGQFVRGQRLDILRTPDRFEQPHLVRSSRRGRRLPGASETLHDRRIGQLRSPGSAAPGRSWQERSHRVYFAHAAESACAMTDASAYALPGTWAPAARPLASLPTPAMNPARRTM